MTAQVVAVVEGVGTALLQLDHLLAVAHHRAEGLGLVTLRVRRAQRQGSLERHAVGHIATQRIVRAGLVGQDVGRDVAFDQAREQFGRVAQNTDRDGLTGGLQLERAVDRRIDALDLLVHVLRPQSEVDARLVDLGHQTRTAVHGRGQRLRAAHAAEPRGDDEASLQRATEVARGGGCEGLVRALQDPLGADVDPGPRGHLAVHHLPGVLELAEVLPGRPLAHQVRVRDQHARCALVRAHHADRLARLDQQRLVRLEPLQRADDRVQRRPVARGLARSTVDDEVLGPLGHVRVQVVQQHAQRGFRTPRLARALGSGRRQLRARGQGHRSRRGRIGGGHGNLGRVGGRPG